MTLTYLNQENFKDEVEKSKVPVIIDFYADWCGPCRMMAPIFEALSAEYKGKVKFLKLDTEQEQELAMQFEVMSIPSLVIIHEGKEVDRLIGFMPKPMLKAKIDHILTALAPKKSAKK